MHKKARVEERSVALTSGYKKYFGFLLSFLIGLSLELLLHVCSMLAVCTG